MSLPTYNHTLVTEFINYPEGLPNEKIDEGLALPRESFIEDLEKFISDLQNRREWYYENVKEHYYLLTYAVNFLSILEANESLPKVVEIIEEDENFLDFWFGEFLEPSYISFLFYPFFKDDFDGLWNIIMQKENCYLIHSGLINIPAQVALKEPEKRQEALDFYANLIEFIFKLEEKDSLFDEFEIDMIIQSIFLLKGTELREQVLELHKEGLTDEFLWNKKQTIEEFENFDYSIRSDKKLNLELTPYEIFEKSMGDNFLQELNEEEKERQEKEIQESMAKHKPMLEGISLLNQYDPKTDKALYSRNDKVTVKYEDGKMLENIKYKKVEKDVKEGKCFIV
jgi:hypothetical protein